MDYIRQRKAFRAYKRAHLKELSAAMIAVWDAIFDILNDRCWPEGAAVINKHELLAEFPASETTLRRAIGALEAMGLLRVQAETRTMEAAYEMVKLYAEGAERGTNGTNSVRVASSSYQVPINFPSDSRDFCKDSDATGEAAEEIPTIDRACACARQNQNVNQNVNPNKNEDEEEERACGGETAGKETRAARARLDPAEEGRAVEETGTTLSQVLAEIERGGGEASDAWQEPGLPENGADGRAWDAARACGFSNSKRNREKIGEMEREYGAEWACAAIDRAAMRGADKCNTGYVQAILSRWAAAGSMDEPDAYSAEKRNEYANATAWKNRKNDVFRRYEQRTYTQEEDARLFTDIFKNEEETWG